MSYYLWKRQSIYGGQQETVSVDSSYTLTNNDLTIYDNFKTYGITGENNELNLSSGNYVITSNSFNEVSVDFSIGEQNKKTVIGWKQGTSGVGWEGFYSFSNTTNFLGDVGFYIGEETKNLGTYKAVIEILDWYDERSKFSDNIHILIPNGFITNGTNVKVCLAYGETDFEGVEVFPPYLNQTNSLYNYTQSIEKDYYDEENYEWFIYWTITPQTSAQIQTAGFTASQANRLVEIMQTQHGADPTNDEIVKLAQMGDIAGAKELLGGDAPVIKQRQAYLNGKMRQTFVNGKQRNIYIGASNE